MIAVDSNVLVYAHRRDSPWHRQAEGRLRGLAEGRRPWMIPWPCLHEFLAIVTHPRIYRPSSTIEQALRQVDCWLESPSLILGCESPSYWGRFRILVVKANPVGALIHDARVAAICLEHAVDVLWSADRDFSRFPDLRTENPLVTG